MTIQASPVPLSIIIVNTNHCDLLRQCLAALRQADLPAGTEIIVVDNASTDSSGEMVEHEYPEARLLRQAVRRGPAANYNAGFRVARGEFLVVLNEDAEVTPTALRRLHAYMQGHPRVGIAGPRLIYPDGTPQQSCNRFPSFSVVFKRLLLQAVMQGPWVQHGYAEEIRSQTFQPDWIMATSLVIRRAALEEVGLYDEQFEIYYEEVDLARRMRDRRWTVAWVSDALVKHHHGVSNLKLRGDRDILFRLLMYQSRYRYFRKHQGRTFTAAIRCVEAWLFSLFVCKTTLESLLPSRRSQAAMKTRLYAALLRYAIWGGGNFTVPQS
jgi:N-acetylglucosaminyl-diphospho-decaprenol L-rhamnosyltransferase